MICRCCLHCSCQPSSNPSHSFINLPDHFHYHSSGQWGVAQKGVSTSRGRPMRWSHIPALVTPTWLVTSHGKLQSTNNWLPTTMSGESSPSWWPQETLKQKCLQHSATACPSYFWPHIHMIALLQQLLPICYSKWQFNPNSSSISDMSWDVGWWRISDTPSQLSQPS